MRIAATALTHTPGTSGELTEDAADVRAQLAALHPSSFAWALACCDRRRHDAEDVLHDVYVDVLANGASFQGRSTFRTWLFGVIARTARSRARRQRVRELLAATRAFRIDAPAPAQAADELAVASDSRARTLRALDKLSRRQRDVLQLVFYHDLTIDEAAKVMNVSLGSARVHYQRGKERMAVLLREER